MNFATFKMRVLLALLGFYLLFNYGFIQIRLPPGFGIPLGEIFLVFALLTTNVPLVLSRMGAVATLIPFLIWWGLALGRMTIDVLHYGFWALRDATQAIESLYLIVGFTVAAYPNIVEKLMRRLPLILAGLCIYGLGFPFAEAIGELSPKIAGASGQPVPLLGTFATTRIILLWTAFYCIIIGKHSRLSRLGRMGIAWFLIGFAIVVVQSRTTYIQIAGLTIVLLIFRRRAIGSMILAVPAVLFMLALITVLEVKIPGRLTEEVSFSFLADHFAAIFGVGGEQGGGVAAAAQGVPLRLNWWTELYERIADDTAYLLTGLGYGIPLTNFVNELGIITREPHNSYVSVVARIGLIGFAAWLWMQVGLFAAAARAYYQLRSEAARTFLLMTIAFGTLLLVEAFGEDAMEKPYHAIPYYTFFGFALRIAFAGHLQARAHAHAHACHSNFAPKCSVDRRRAERRSALTARREGLAAPPPSLPELDGE